MSRSAHTYRLGDVEVVLTVPEGIIAPPYLTIGREADRAVARFAHVGVKALRAPVKRKPRQASPLTKMTEDWVPPADAVEKIRGSVPSVNIDFESEQYRDWAISKGEGRADWVAGWRTWLRRTHKTNVERGWKPTRKPRADETPKERWIRTHGLTVAEYEAKKGDKEWLAMIERRGVVA